MQGDGPCLVPNNAVGRDPAPGLKSLYRGHGRGTKFSVDRSRRRVPLPGCSVGKNLLQTADDSAGRALSKRRHRSTAGKCGPCSRPNNAVDDQTGALLELFDGSLSRRTEDAVNNEPRVWRSTQRPLESTDDIAGRSKRYGWLTRIRHMHPPLMTRKQIARHAARLGFPNTGKQRFFEHRAYRRRARKRTRCALHNMAWTRPAL